MTPEPRIPVLVGAGMASQRFDDPVEGDDALGLMRLALERAGVDAGAGGPALLARVGEIIVPEGLWSLDDPGRLVLGARSPDARSVMAKVGILQQSLFTRAAQAIADGRVDVVVVCGGEAKWRALRAQIEGVALPDPEASGGSGPDVVLAPASLRDLVDPVEVERGLALPVSQYSLMESALRYAAGRAPSDHRRRVAALVAAMSEVAAANPDAWNRRPMTPDQVLDAPLVAEPYTKPSCSQWNVDQAAAFVLCAAETASAVGVPRDRWVFPHAGVESNHVVSLSQRRGLHRSPAVAQLGQALTSAVGRPPAACELLEIYSCFPAAVEMQCEGLGIDIEAGRALTVTGGMHFGGGPFNSFTLQALARLVTLLREDPSSTALLTSVSGLMTKVGAGLWSARPPATAFVRADVSAAAAAATEICPRDPDADGQVTIAGYTVGHGRDGPVDAVIVADTASGGRTVARSTDPDLVDALRDGEWCGRTASVRGAALLGLAD